MNDSMISVKIFENDEFLNKLIFNETPEDDEQIKYMGVIKIGRMSTAHIKLDSPSVSRMHATIEYQGGDFLFTLMARTDTFINDRKVDNSKILLREGDRITIDEVTLVVYPGIDADDIDDEDTIEPTVKSPDDLFEDDDEYDDDSFDAITADELPSEEFDTEDINKNIYFSVTEDDGNELRATIGKGLEVKHYWYGNMIASKLFSPTDVVTVGPAEEDSFYVNPEYLPNKASFKIAENGKDVNFFPNNVHYIEGEEEYNLEELIEAQKVVMKTNHGAIRLLYKTKIAFELEENRFEINSIPIYAPIARNSKRVFFDGLNTKYTIISLITHMIIVFLMYLSPPEIESFNLEKLNNIPERYANVILDVPKEEEKKEKVEFENKGKKDIKYSGKSDSDDVVFVKGKDFKNLTRKQLQIKKLVNSTGMLGAINKGGSGLNTSSGTFGGYEDDDIRLEDNSANSVAANSANPGVRGGASGPGGGGRSLGTGGPGTSSGGRYASGRYNKGIRGLPGGKKRSRRMRVKIKDNMISGNLTRRQIETVVRRHIDQMRYCYEKELLRKPKLKGVVTVIWKINPQGRVVFAKIGGGTLKDRAVQSCMVSRIKGWKFPEPKGGGYAKVKYPFSFRSN